MHISVDEDFVAFVKNRLRGRIFVDEDSTMVMMLGHPIQFVVTKTVPDGIVKITPTTELTIESSPVVESKVARRQAKRLTRMLRKSFRRSTRDNTVMTRLSNEDLKQIDTMVGTGLFESRSEAVAYLTHEGIIAKREMFTQLSNKYKQIEKIRDEAKALLRTSAPISSLRECPKCKESNNPESKFCSSCGEKLSNES